MTQVAEAEVIEAGEASGGASLALATLGSTLALAPIMNVQQAVARLAEFQTFVRGYLVESKDGGEDGGDYGVLPGTKKRTLLKSGADKLCEVYGLYDDYSVVTRVEDWDRGLFDYEMKCTLRRRSDDGIIGSGIGSCSTYESKYRWRMQQRRCPACSAETIIKGREEYGGGWLCYAKKGGCGAKYQDTDQRILGQSLERVQNPDIIDAKNTVLKMAKKRAKIDAVISVTRSAGLFTQDVEDQAATSEQLIVERVGGTESSEASSAGASAPAAQAAQPAAAQGQRPSGDSRTISEAQSKRLFAIAKESGIDEAGIVKKIKTMGYAAMADITRKDYDAIVEWARRGGD